MLAVVDDGVLGRAARERLRDEILAAPDLMKVEALSVLRRLTLSRQLEESVGSAAIADLVDLPVSPLPTAGLLTRAWELRSNFTAYDAVYVAAAEALHCALLTADRRLAAAPGPTCPIEVIDP